MTSRRPCIILNRNFNPHNNTFQINLVRSAEELKSTPGMAIGTKGGYAWAVGAGLNAALAAIAAKFVSFQVTTRSDCYCCWSCLSFLNPGVSNRSVYYLNCSKLSEIDAVMMNFNQCIEVVDDRSFKFEELIADGKLRLL